MIHLTVFINIMDGPMITRQRQAWRTRASYYTKVKEKMKENYTTIYASTSKSMGGSIGVGGSVPGFVSVSILTLSGS